MIVEEDIMENGKTNRIRRWTITAVTLIGISFFFLTFSVDALGVGRSPGFGLIQMALLLISITCLTIAAFAYLYGRRSNAPRSLQADIGIRLGATGLVFTYVAGFADLLRIGTHPHPDFPAPFVGEWQIGGIIVGIIAILAGMLLYYTSRAQQDASSMEFILNGK